VDQGKASGKYQIPIRGVAPPSGLQLYGTPRELNGRPFSHEGVDFNGSGNPPTYPIATGNVVFARWNGAYGNMVKVDHGNGTRSEYGHLDSISVKEGQQVYSDTILGKVGNTGNSFGAHLHLNTIVNGKQVNPLTILDTNYSYSPTLVEGNNRYAVLQLSPGTLSVDEAPFMSKELQEEGLTAWIRANLANGSKVAKDSTTTNKSYIDVDSNTTVGDNYVRAASCGKMTTYFVEIGKSIIKSDPGGLGSFDVNANPTNTIERGMIIINPYLYKNNKNAKESTMLIRDGIYDRYKSINGCKWFGYPVRFDKPTFPGELPYQRFINNTSEYNKMSIVGRDLFKNETVYFTSGENAIKENLLRVPLGDSQTEDNMKDKDGNVIYCKQSFADSNKNFDNLCKQLTAPMANSFSRLEHRETKLELDKDNASPISNECQTNIRYCYDVKNIWIDTHGMSTSNIVYTDYHKDIINSLKKYNQESIQLFYNWGEYSKEANILGSGAPTPTNVDEYIGEQTSQKLAKRIMQWGLKDGSKLNLVGHSMGTMIVNETAKNLISSNDKTSNSSNLKSINRIFYLDPPKWNGLFVVDYPNSNENYSGFSGYNSKGVKANIMRAFVGSDKYRKVNLCGNSDFARTAIDWIRIKFNNGESNSVCAVHGGVPFVFAEVVKLNGLLYSKKYSRNLDLLNDKNINYSTESIIEIYNNGLPEGGEIRSKIENNVEFYSPWDSSINY
jgi:Peptidase family M23